MSGPPDPSNPDLLEGVRSYLISQGIVRDPRDGTQPTLPPLWLAPRFGTPAPGESEGLAAVEVGPTLVASIRKETGIPSQPFEGFIRKDGVGWVVRASEADLAYAFEQQVRTVLNDKRGWTMSNVEVIESLLYRDLQPIASNNLGYTFTMEYMFELWTPNANVNP